MCACVHTCGCRPLTQLRISDKRLNALSRCISESVDTEHLGSMCWLAEVLLNRRDVWLSLMCVVQWRFCVGCDADTTKTVIISEDLKDHEKKLVYVTTFRVYSHQDVLEITCFGVG